jgi:predicted DNA-binding transcriptional regulator AlpA
MTAARQDDDDRPGENMRTRWVRPADVAEQLSISERQAQRLAADGAFGPRIRIGHHTVRVQQAGVDAFLRRAEDGGRS